MAKHFDVLPSFPDNNDTKEVTLLAAGKAYAGTGERHVALFWVNCDNQRNLFVTQVNQRPV